MQDKTERKLPNDVYFNKGIGLAKDYFLNSDERYIAWLLLIGAILSVFALVALTSLLSSWTVGFWAALTAKDFSLFIASMEVFGYTVGCYTCVSVLKNYFVELLGIRWRNWLTQKLINKYISGDNNYLDLMRLSSQIDNPEQRIQEDIQSFVNLSLSLSLDFLNSILTLATFIGTLWVVGGSLSVVLLGASITIPGYLVWAAILFSELASVITSKIGRSLTTLADNQQRLEANFRTEMELLKNESESIAQEHAESYYKQSLINKCRDISANLYQTLRVRTNLIAFQSFYFQFASILPYIAAAPLYFSGHIELGQLMQIGFAFGQVQSSLSWFVSSFETIAKYKASLGRIIELDNMLKSGGLNATKKAINVKENDRIDELLIEKLNTAYPSSTNVMMRGLNLKFNRGENTLLNGPSGLGKSTLFKVMAGTWRYGDGEVSVPNYCNSCFLPQRPSLPNDTLRAVLAYPEPVDTYTDEQYIAVLHAVGHMDQFIEELNINAAWSKRLSPGQQQRISFARALLRKPDWLFLDEATASLDPASEHHIYSLVKNQLKNTTFISIAHRATVDQFHDRVITFETDNDSAITLRERRINKRYIDAANDENRPSSNHSSCVYK